MPAHISVMEVMKMSVGFLDQKTCFTASGALMNLMPKTMKGRQLGAKDHGVSPATVARLAEYGRSKRERPYTSYAAYRAAMDDFNPKEGLKSCGYELKSPDLKTLTDNIKNDSKGFQHFKTEWQLHLKTGTALDQAIAQLFGNGWVVTMIMGKDKRNEQLKRLEGTRPGHSQVKVLWTLD